MYLIASLGILAFALSLVLTPPIRDAFIRIGLLDYPDKFRKVHPHPVPRAGGLVIAISYILSFGIALLLPFSFATTISAVLPQFWLLLPAAEMIFITGLIDDVVGLKPWQKLAGQTVACYLAYVAGVQVHAIADFVLHPILAGTVSVLWLLACTNAFNLIDGMDGLAAGVGLFAAVTVFIAALTHHSLDLALVTIPLIGSLLGFLRYNFNPASVFLGDSGSLLIGFMLGCFGVLWSQKSATILGMTAPLMAVSIPLLDASLAIVRRYIRKKPLFEADSGHIHHRLIALGLTPRRAALLMYAVCGLAAALSLMQDMFENRFSGLIVVLFCMMAWIGVQHLGYVEFGVARQIFVKGTFRRIIDAHTLLKHLENRLEEARDGRELWLLLCDGVAQFGFQPVEMRLAGQSYGRAGAPEDFWQVRIPVADGDYVNLRHQFEIDLDSVPVALLVNVIKRAVSRCHARLHSAAPFAEAGHAR